MNEYIINSYEDFKRCIRESEEQRQYVGGGDKRYWIALNKLIKEDHDRYMAYSQKMNEEFKRKRA